jgi:phosphatidylinositol alpha-1,6-mannosyltransferase
MSESPLRVLVVTPDYPPARGGIQLLTARVVANLPNAVSRVVTVDSPGATEWDQANGNGVVRVPTGASRRLSIVGMNAIALREARRFKPAVVLASHIVASPAAALVSRVFGVPSVVYAHAKEIGASPGLARFGLATSDAVIAVSHYTRGLVLKAGARPDRVHRITPGVDVFEPERVPRRSRPTIVTVARLEDRYKGHDVIVRALPLIRARVPDAEWVVIGEGPLRDDIARLAKSYDVSDAVTLLGSVSDEERNGWLDRAHVFCMPSRLPLGRAAGEGFGIVYLEAGLHGLPVVAGNVGGAVDAVAHDQTGLLVDPTSHVAVADAIADLLLDRERAERMGSAGATRARDFAWELIGARVGAVLAELAEGGEVR